MQVINKPVTTTKDVAVLGRLDIERALRDFLLQQGYEPESLVDFKYDNGILSTAEIVVTKKPILTR